MAAHQLLEDADRADVRAGLKDRHDFGVEYIGKRFTGSPHIGLGLAPAARDYTLGWRLALATGPFDRLRTN